EDPGDLLYSAWRASRFGNSGRDGFIHTDRGSRGKRGAGNAGATGSPQRTRRCQAVSYLASRLFAALMSSFASILLPFISSIQDAVTGSDAFIQVCLSASDKVRIVLPFPRTIFSTSAPAWSQTLPASVANGIPVVSSITLRTSSGNPSYFA